MSSSQISSSSSSPYPEGGGLGHILDVRCGVDFVIGTGTLKVRDCLRLERHSVVRLDQPAGADIEMRVHGVALVVGEVVIIDDNTALRVSRVLSSVANEAA